MARHTEGHDHSGAVMPALRTTATRHFRHRGYSVAVAAVARTSGVTAYASLTGGPDHIVRTFAVPCYENEVTLACETVATELLGVIDDLETHRGTRAPRL